MTEEKLKYPPEHLFICRDFNADAPDNFARAQEADYIGINPLIKGKSGRAWFGKGLYYFFCPSDMKPNDLNCHRVVCSSLKFKENK